MKRLILITVFTVLGAASGSASTVGPFGNDIFVRGGFNGWGAIDAMTWDPVDEQFDAIITISAGTWEFKIADEGWSNPDFAPLGDPNVTLGVPYDIGTAIGQNGILTLADSGDYLFVLSDLASDLQSGVLTVTAIPLPAALVLFASGLAGLSILRRRR